LNILYYTINRWKVIKMINKNRFEQGLITFPQMNLLFRVRLMWRELATWTRAYLVSRFIGGSFYEEVFSKLFSIPQNFGQLFQLVLGVDIADQYVKLLSEHIILLRDYIEAQISGDENMANEKYRSLYQNADERAKFLASHNPFWTEMEWRNLFYTYLNRTIEEITSFLTGDYKTNISIFDRILAHADNLGDYFMTGIYSYMSYNNLGNPELGPSR